MRTFYCAVNKGEDQQGLKGERFDAMTEHMVVARGYDLSTFDVVARRGNVVWQMRREGDHYVFDHIVLTSKDL